MNICSACGHAHFGHCAARVMRPRFCAGTKLVWGEGVFCGCDPVTNRAPAVPVDGRSK
jgi:hypothetical protein